MEPKFNIGDCLQHKGEVRSRFNHKSKFFVIEVLINKWMGGSQVEYTCRILDHMESFRIVTLFDIELEPYVESDIDE